MNVNLEHACTTAISLTRELHDALACEDFSLCEALLVRRADAMVRFENRHRAADAAEQAACRDLLVELQRRDHDLQDKAAEVFALAGQAYHARMGAQPTRAYGPGFVPENPGYRA